MVVRIVQPGPAPNAARTAISGAHPGPIPSLPPPSAGRTANSGVHFGPVPLTATQIRQRGRAGEFGETTVWAIDKAKRAESDRLKQWYTDLAAILARDAYHYATLSMTVEER